MSKHRNIGIVAAVVLAAAGVVSVEASGPPPPKPTATPSKPPVQRPIVKSSQTQTSSNSNRNTNTNTSSSNSSAASSSSSVSGATSNPVVNVSVPVQITVDNSGPSAPGGSAGGGCIPFVGERHNVVPGACSPSPSAYVPQAYGGSAPSIQPPRTGDAGLR